MTTKKSEGTKAAAWRELLIEEGFRPEVIEPGKLLSFKREGLTYLVDVDEPDPHFVHIILPNVWEIESEDERAQALQAANRAMSTIKVSKIVLRERHVSLSIEMFLPGIGDLRGLLNRSMVVLDDTRRRFVDAMSHAASDPFEKLRQSWTASSRKGEN